MSLGELFLRLHEQPTAEAEATARRVGASANHPSVVISACLVGIPCRYDGHAKPFPHLEELLQKIQPIPLCPEVLARLGTPRVPMQFVGGDGAAALRGDARLLDEQDRDCTEAVRGGVTSALRLARAAGCTRAILKARSPSCGVHQVHTRQGLIAGSGMFAAACLASGLEVVSDESL